jgi:hypothetical protein
LPTSDNKGRIVFLQGAGVICAVDFTVGTGNSVTSNPKRLFPASFMTERVGRDPTWVGNDVVMQRRTPMDGSGKCSSTTSISTIDLDSSTETVLVTGHNPDGR